MIKYMKNQYYFLLFSGKNILPKWSLWALLATTPKNKGIFSEDDCLEFYASGWPKIQFYDVSAIVKLVLEKYRPLSTEMTKQLASLVICNISSLQFPTNICFDYRFSPQQTLIY